METVRIYGDVVGSDAVKGGADDFAPSDFPDVAEPLCVEINSYGGDVLGGFAIVSAIEKRRAEGHETTARITGVAASIASVIACACDKIVMCDSAYMMIHNPWVGMYGNADELRKEADTLDRLRDTMLRVYASKFSCGEDAIRAMLDAETWIDAPSAADYGLSVEVENGGGEPLKYAAKLMAYKNTPSAFRGEESAPPCDGDRNGVEERVRGMQSAMQKQINAERKARAELEEDFKARMVSKEKELAEANAKATNLSAELESVKEELRKTASTLDETRETLAEINARVNTPNEDSVNWRNLHGAAFWAYLKAHKNA